MKRTLFILFLLGCCTESHADTLTGRVVRVTDGDTIVVLDPSVTTRYAHLSTKSLQAAADSASDVIESAMKESA